MSEIVVLLVCGQEIDDCDVDEQQDEDEGCVEIYCVFFCVLFVFYVFLVLKYMNVVIIVLMKI